MNSALKQQVHELIDNCEDAILLKQVKELLQTEKDWWDELTEDNKNLVTEIEYEKGNLVSQVDLMKQFEEWQKK